MIPLPGTTFNLPWDMLITHLFPTLPFIPKIKLNRYRLQEISFSIFLPKANLLPVLKLHLIEMESAFLKYLHPLVAGRGEWALSHWARLGVEGVGFGSEATNGDSWFLRLGRNDEIRHNDQNKGQPDDCSHLISPAIYIHSLPRRPPCRGRRQPSSSLLEPPLSRAVHLTALRTTGTVAREAY